MITQQIIDLTCILLFFVDLSLVIAVVSLIMDYQENQRSRSVNGKE